MLCISGPGYAFDWNFSHWPSSEVLTNLTDNDPLTCVKFTLVQLGRHILLNGTNPRLSNPPQKITMYWKNLAIPTGCEPSILVLNQVKFSKTTEESVCRPFCGQLVRRNLSKITLYTRGRIQNLRSVVARFPSCNPHQKCKGIYIHITDKALADTRLDLELCEITP